MARTRPARGLLAVCVLSLAVIAFGWAAARSNEATGPGVVRLTDLQTSMKNTGGSELGVGDVQIAGLQLFGGAVRSRPIGKAVLMCMYVSKTLRSCNGSYILPRGMIETSGLINSRLLYTAAITGGTGLYDNARGTLTVTAKGLKPRRELLLFRLSG